MADFNMLAAILLCFTSFAFSANGYDDQDTNALSYDADIFAAELQKKRHFVMFYAPWCGHCKNIAPTWNELARIYNNAENSPVVIAKVDCTVHTGLCADHSVVGFPTLKMFNVGGDQHKRYSGKRDFESLKRFIQQQVTGLGNYDVSDEEERHKTLDSEKQDDVADTKASPVVLTDENFDELVGKGLFFIEFFTPWCGHCKKLAPTWDDLADIFNHDNKVTIAKIDCTQHKITCKLHDITGYPSLLWFKDGKKVEKFQGPRSHEALKNYVKTKLLGQDKSEASVSKSSVKDLTDETFESLISSSDLVFVKFFAPWCTHCKQLAPVWEQLAETLLNHPVSIAKVDCTLYKTICDNNQVGGYPTLKLFHKGTFVKDYKGFRSFERLYRFVKDELRQHDEL